MNFPEKSRNVDDFWVHLKEMEVFLRVRVVWVAKPSAQFFQHLKKRELCMCVRAEMIHGTMETQLTASCRT